MQEFNLIKEKFFKTSKVANKSAIAIDFAIGDDCAIFAKNIAISHDTLNAGVHFFASDTPEDIAHKAFAVNLSDLAAMAAQPVGFLLALSLPPTLAQNETWLDIFSQTLNELAHKHHCPLIGGDTTRAEHLSIGITILGQTSEHIPYRHQAQIGDDIWITGALGQARLALEHHLGTLNFQLRQEYFLTCQQALYRPPARIALMQELAPFIHAAIDISDGLAADLGHILEASKLSAELYLKQFIIAPTLSENLPEDLIPSLLLNAGDDYEICFTAPADVHVRAMIGKISHKYDANCQRVGRCVANAAISHQESLLKDLSNSNILNILDIYDDENNLNKLNKLNIFDLKGFTGFQHF